MTAIDIYAEHDAKSGDITGKVVLILSDDDGSLAEAQVTHVADTGDGPYTSVKIVADIVLARQIFAGTGASIRYIEDHADSP